MRTKAYILIQWTLCPLFCAQCMVGTMSELSFQVATAQLIEVAVVRLQKACRIHAATKRHCIDLPPYVPDAPDGWDSEIVDALELLSFMTGDNRYSALYRALHLTLTRKRSSLITR